MTRMFNKKKKLYMLEKIFIYSLFLCILMFCFSSCGASGGSNGKAGESSPYVAECTVNAGCNGGEDDQYVEADIKFDRNVICSTDAAAQLRVVIGGERVKTDNIEISQDDASADTIKLLIIGINKVTNGVIEITSADGEDVINGITDESGKYSAKSLEIKKLIPSGAAIEQFGKSEPGESPAWTSIRVTSPPSHRSMIWLQLVDNGNVVEPDDMSSPDIMDDTAVGIHEHEFLFATNESVAEDIAKAVNDFYGESFTAENNGNEVTVTAIRSDEKTDTGLELRLYEY